MLLSRGCYGDAIGMSRGCYGDLVWLAREGLVNTRAMAPFMHYAGSVHDPNTSNVHDPNQRFPTLSLVYLPEVDLLRSCVPAW